MDIILLLLLELFRLPFRILGFILLKISGESDRGIRELNKIVYSMPPAEVTDGRFRRKVKYD